jgi:hypothetical protein
MVNPNVMRASSWRKSSSQNVEVAMLIPVLSPLQVAGEQTRVAWTGRPAKTAAMVIVGCGIGLVITVTKTVNVKQSIVDSEGRLFTVAVVHPFVTF